MEALGYLAIEFGKMVILVIMLVVSIIYGGSLLYKKLTIFLETNRYLNQIKKRGYTVVLQKLETDLRVLNLNLQTAQKSSSPGDSIIFQSVKNTNHPGTLIREISIKQQIRKNILCKKHASISSRFKK